MSELPAKVALVDTKMALEASEMFGIPSTQLVKLIKHQIISVPQGEAPASDAELALVLSTIYQAGLNPLTGQVYAWRDNKGKMAVHVSPDGWARTAKNDPDFKYPTFNYGPILPSPDGQGQECYEWMEMTIHTTSGDEVPQPRVYLNEWYVPQRGNYKGQWQKQTKHRLFIVTFRLGIRFFCGLSGVAIDEENPHYSTDKPNQGQKTDEATERMAAEMHGFKSDVEVNYEVVEDEMVDAMAGEYTPASDDPELDEPPGTWVHRSKYEDGSVTPLLDSLEAPECAVPLCKTAGTNKCGSCGEVFCLSHMSEDPERCRVCFDGGE